MTWSRGRRFGPPEDAERPLPPPRRAYVDAVTASVLKTKDRTVVVDQLRAAATASLARRTGATGPLEGAAVRDAARRAALSDEEVDAVAGNACRDDDVLALGRALARLRSGR